MTNPNWDPDIFIRQVKSYRSELALLCGTGVSSTKSAPSGKTLQCALLRKIDRTKTLTEKTKAQKQEGERVGLRFEGLMEVLARTVDKDLDLLEWLYYKYRRKGPSPTAAHELLARIALNNPVITPNFDVLIEQAMQKLKLRTSSGAAWHKLVFCTPEQWRRKTRPVRGLWKIHGTIRRWNQRKGWVADPDCSPVTTLRSLARWRRNPNRKRVFMKICSSSPLLVLGYSGVDDFDITLWLKKQTARSNLPLFWIAYEGKKDLPKDLLEAWKKRKGPVFALNAEGKDAIVLSVLEVVAHTKAKLPVATMGKWKHTLNNWCKKKMPTAAHRHIVHGEILKHRGFFRAAIGEYNNAREADTPRCLRPRKILFSCEAIVESGDQNERQDALRKIRKLMYDGSLSEPSDRLSASILEARLLRLLGKAEQLQECAERLEDRIANSKEDETQARAAAELQTLIRRDLSNYEYRLQKGKFSSLIQNSLYAEASKTKDDGYKEAREATTTDRLQEGIEKIKKAANLQLQLGAFKDYCSSVNVMGTFSQKLAEWYAWTSPGSGKVEKALKAAVFYHERSCRIAKNRKYRWEEGQAHLGLAVLNLRIARFKRGAFGRNVAAAKSHYTSAKKALGMNRDDENLFLWFLKVLLKLTQVSHLREAAKIGEKEFESLLKQCQQSSNSRLEPALQLNLNVCKTIDKAGALPASLWLVEYWNKRSKCLRDAIRNRTSLTPARLSQVLFDPFYPE